MSTRKGHIFFLGIGGIGMSALARFYISKGFVVKGYDKVPSVITTELQQLGAEITFEDQVGILEGYSDEDLYVRTPAVPLSSNLFKFVEQKGWKWMKRAELLGVLSRDYTTLAVAGTHGKTTTSCLLVHVLKVAGIDTNAFLGGIAKNYQTNYLQGTSEFLVVEADEYDRSFLHLHPAKSIITGNQPDHLDIYQTEEAFQEAFRMFANQTTGSVFVADNAKDVIPGVSYGGNPENDYYYHGISWDGKSKFAIKHDGQNIGFELAIPGIHNIENACGVYALAKSLGINDAKIQEAFVTFEGVDRRFNIKGEKRILIDDYAHHPDELKSLIQSVRKMFPERKMTLVFQPHLYSRTQDFMEGFARELSATDDLIVLPIYPAREAPIPGVTSEALVDKATLGAKRVVAYESLLGELEEMECELLVMAGAGDIGLLSKELERNWNG